VQLEELGKLKKSSDLIGTQTRDLPACSVEPRPTTLSLAPTHRAYPSEIPASLSSGRHCYQRRGSGDLAHAV
jgi:hypothetical protein